MHRKNSKGTLKKSNALKLKSTTASLRGVNKESAKRSGINFGGSISQSKLSKMGYHTHFASTS